jgi:hypothetical protein
MAVSAAGAQGSGLAQPPVTLLNTVNAITQKYIIPVLGDTVMVPSPAYWLMTRRGKKFAGGELVYPILTAEEMTGGAYYGDQLLDTSVVDTVQPADQVWKFYRQAIAIPTTDVILNRGGAGSLDLIRTKYQIASSSFLQKLCRALWNTAPQNTSLDLDDILHWLGWSGGTAFANTNVIAGIDRSVAANSWWQAAAVVGGGSAALSQNTAESAYQSVVYGYDEPDALLMDNTRYGNFKGTLFSTIRFMDDDQDNEALNAGFRYHFLFNSAVTMADRFVPANIAVLLNTKYIFPVFHEADYFTVDPFIKPSNQRVVVSTMYTTLQIICPSPRMNVPINAIS